MSIPIRTPFVLPMLTAAPSPTEALAYYDTALHQFGVYDGTTWVYLGASAGATNARAYFLA